MVAARALFLFPAAGVHPVRRGRRAAGPPAEAAAPTLAQIALDPPGEDAMKRVLPILFITAFALALAGAAPAPPPDTLVEQGNQALAAGDFARAIELYEKAEPRAADPGEVTINLA